MRNIWRFFAAGLIGALFATPAWAQRDYEARLPEARRELNRAEVEARFPLADTRCRAAIEARDADWMKPWCNLATQHAIQAREREQRDAFTTAEQELLIQAAWVHALDGLPELNIGQLRHPIETVPLGNEADTLRLGAYRILADLRSHRTDQISRSFQAMMRHLEVPMRRDDSMRSVRRRLLDAVLAEPRTPLRARTTTVRICGPLRSSSTSPGLTSREGLLACPLTVTRPLLISSQLRLRVL